MTELSLLYKDWTQLDIEECMCDVAVIGSGPAGLSCAAELKRYGAGHVMVLEREQVAGGIPRRCNHYPFGMREYHRLMKGPSFARRNVKVAQKTGVDIRTGYSVMKLERNGLLLVAMSSGVIRIKAKRVVLATGVRETPRSARLISGTRPRNVINTGTLLSDLALKQLKPFHRPLIVGSELVSLSAINSCLKAGIRPVAVIDEHKHPLSPWPVYLYPRLRRVPLLMGTRLVDIHGLERVEAASIKLSDGTLQRLQCDGIVLTGKFLPEASLIYSSHLALDPLTQGPRIDQYGRCSDPTYYAVGNILRAVETGGWSWQEGKAIASYIVDDLDHHDDTGHRRNVISIQVAAPIKYCVPQQLVISPSLHGHLQLRVSSACKGKLQAVIDDKVVWSKKGHFLPERRILIPLEELRLHSGSSLKIHVVPDTNNQKKRVTVFQEEMAE